MLAISVAIHLLCQVATIQKLTPAAPTPEEKAVAFLSREVPRWSRQKHCFSCHNNGDAAPALLHAAARGLKVPDAALADTTRWLQKPESWEHNGGEGPFSDKRLARLAFTAALATAVSTGRVSEREAVVKAARALALDQAADGSWPLEGEDATSAPATYGRPLATLLARQSLATADAAGFRLAIDRADGWLKKLNTRNATEASVILLAFSVPARPPAGDSPLPALWICSLASRRPTAAGAWTPSRLPSPSIRRSRCWPSRSASQPDR